jgi:hypothetical protein
MLPCFICGHPGIHAVVVGLDGALPQSCGDQCRFCMAEPPPTEVPVRRV